MRGMVRLVGSLMLAVLLWTANVAHANELVGCVETNVETVGHFDGDGDQSSSDSGNALPHHHGSGCHGHHNVVEIAGADAPARSAMPTLLNRQTYRQVSGQGPPAALRPPIA